MQINAIASLNSLTGTTQAFTAATTTQSSAANGDAFMQMLMAQLRNQNPLQPMDDTAMMSQVTQLNSLQTLQTIKVLMTQSATASQATYATSLIGKSVTATLADGTRIEGVVTSTSVKEELMLLHIGDKTVTLGSVIAVKGA